MDATTTAPRARTALALTLMLGALAATGNAAAELYIGFGSGRANLDDRLFGASDEFNGDDTSEHYFMGFKLGRNTRIEFGRTDLGFMSDTITIGATPTPTTVGIDGHAYSLIFSEPIAEDFAVFLRAGVFEWDRESSGPPTAGNHSGTNGLFGLGGSLRVSENLSLRAEYQRYEVGHSDIDVPVLAVVYRF